MKFKGIYFIVLGFLALRGYAEDNTNQEHPVGHGTALQFRGLANITDQLVSDILNLSQIRSAKTTPHILLDPIINETKLVINTQLLLGRMRVMLNSKAKNKIRFIDHAMVRRVETQFEESPSSAMVEKNKDTYHPEMVFLESRLIEEGQNKKLECMLTHSSSREVLWKTTYEVSPEFFDPPHYR
jgi:Peptidoglycan-synthase activator LpoB